MLRSWISEASTGSVGARIHAPAPAEQQHRRHGEEGDREPHADAREPHRQTPLGTLQRHSQLHTCSEERDQHGDLAQDLEQPQVRGRIEAQDSGAARSEQEADAEIDHRGAHRHSLDEMIEISHQREQRADDQIPVIEAHLTVP
jgi:hypothetical protein